MNMGIFLSSILIILLLDETVLFYLPKLRKIRKHSLFILSFFFLPISVVGYVHKRNQAIYRYKAVKKLYSLLIVKVVD